MPRYEKDLSKFEARDTQVLGISVDSTFTQKAWIDHLGRVSYPILSDFHPNGEVCRKYGVLRDDGYSERAIFVVDKEGVIRYIDIHDIGDQPNNEELFKALDNL